MWEHGLNLATAAASTERRQHRGVQLADTGSHVERHWDLRQVLQDHFLPCTIQAIPASTVSRLTLQNASSTSSFCRSKQIFCANCTHSTSWHTTQTLIHATVAIKLQNLLTAHLPTHYSAMIYTIHWSQTTEDTSQPSMCQPEKLISLKYW